VGDDADTDDDGDGVQDPVDAFPLNPNESADTDGDGLGNSADTNDDGDTIPDAADGYPLVADGPVSGVISRQVASNPALRLLLDPIHTTLLLFGL
jgi:hypothetical protein